MNAARSATCVCCVGLCFLCPSAYSLPALNGVSSHTHFCLFAAFFSFLEPGGEAKRLGMKRGKGGRAS